MSFQIVPYFGEEVITTSNIEVFINPDDRLRAKAVIEHASAVTAITDEVTFAGARTAAAQLKAILDEIEESKKDAKRPFGAVEKAIDKLAKEIADPVKTAQNRVLGLLNGYVAKLEAARREEQRREAEARRVAQEQAERKIKEAQALLAETQAQLRAAQDEAERTLLRAATQERENKLLREQLAAELEADVEELDQAEPPRGLVPGGRVDHVYEFKLESIQQVCEAGAWRLIKWDLDIRACQDAVRSQLEHGVEEPNLAGIKITKRLSVSVKAASRISQ